MKRISLLIILILALTACRGGEIEDPPTLTALPTTMPAPSTTPPGGLSLPALTGECENYLWPLKTGVRWTYLSTRGETVTMSVGEPAGGIDLLTELGTSRLNCLETTLAGLPPAPFTGHPDLGTGVTWAAPTGEFLPAAGTVSPYGSPHTWSLELIPSGQVMLSAAGYPAPVPIAGGRIVVIATTATLQTLTTPAGTYNALPVSQQYFFDLTIIPPEGGEKQVLITLSATLFFAEGTGIVRMEYPGGTISMADQTAQLGSPVTYDLQSIQVP